MPTVKEVLERARGLPCLFVSDHELGDKFIIEPTPSDHERVRNTRSAYASEVTTTDDLLLRLDFGLYEDNPPIVIHRSDHTLCGASTGICERITHGQGELDELGYFEVSCAHCARYYERVCGEQPDSHYPS